MLWDSPVLSTFGAEGREPSDHRDALGGGSGGVDGGATEAGRTVAARALLYVGVSSKRLKSSYPVPSSRMSLSVLLSVALGSWSAHTSSDASMYAPSSAVGAGEGRDEGSGVGLLDGEGEGRLEGTAEGSGEGSNVGLLDGSGVGVPDGSEDGLSRDLVV